MFEVYSQGRSSNIQIVNGVMSSSVAYRYLLMPTKPGTFPIGPIYIVHNNNRYTGNDVSLTILNQGTSASPILEERAKDRTGDTKDYFLEASVDKKNPYVNEQVTLSLKFYTAVQLYGSPELVEPTTTGFWTEILGNKAPYYQKLNNRNYKVIERKYALFPTQTGELTIGRAVIQATVAAKAKRRSNFDVFGDFFGRGEDVSVRSQPLKINVKPLPTKNRPDNFTGTIGNFEISAKPNKRTVDVNQPVSVSIKIMGTGNIKSVAEPIIPQQEEQFRTYKASSNEAVSKINDKIGGTKVFEEVFIPKRPGQVEIPSISYNFFDPKRSRYRIIKTDPIVLNVTKPEGYVASNEVPYADPDLTIGSQARDIRYIKTEPGDMSRSGSLIIESPLYLVVNGIPLMLLAGMILMRVRQERLSGDIGYARSKAAAKEAKKRLEKAKSFANVNQTEPFFAEIYTALTTYIADKMNISPYGLTSDKIKELLIERNADDELIEKIMKLLQQCDFARFASSSLNQSNIDTALSDAEQVMIYINGVKFD